MNYQLKLEPCLATWAYVISILYDSGDPKNFNLNQIVTEVEKMSIDSNGIEAKDEDDSLFFKIALEKSILVDKNLYLSKRIHKILLKNDNIKFLNDWRTYNRYL